MDTQLTLDLRALNMMIVLAAPCSRLVTSGVVMSPDTSKPQDTGTIVASALLYTSANGENLRLFRRSLAFREFSAGVRRVLVAPPFDA